MATTDLATLRVNVIAQTRDFERGMGRVRKDTKSVGQNLRDIGRQAAMFTAAAAGVGFLAKKTFDLGAAVEETASKYRTVFGPAVGEVNTFLERNARVMGLTDREAQDLVATTGAIVQGMKLGQRESAAFSIEIAKLAGDFASFNNIPIEDTSRAIQAALTGERESLKRLGVVILETDVQKRALLNTGKANAKALTQQEKAYASLQIIQERAGVQMGDLNRTQDSAANVFRKVAASARQFRDDIAVGLLPAMSVLLDVTGEGTEKLAGWGREFRNNGNQIAQWAKLVISMVQGVATGFDRLTRNVLLAGLTIGTVLAENFTMSLTEFKALMKEVADEMTVNMVVIADAFSAIAQAWRDANNAASGDGMEGGLFGPDGIVLNAPEIVGGLNDIQRAAHGIAGAFTDAVADSVMGAKDAFKDFINFAIAELARLAAKFAVFKLLSSAFPGATGAGGFFEGLFNFGGARAHGGPVKRGTSYLVGENGPEMFTANQSGHITPNGAALSIDWSGFPRPMSPQEAARTQESMQLFARQVEEHLASGGRLAGA